MQLVLSKVVRHLITLDSHLFLSPDCGKLIERLKGLEPLPFD